MTYHPHFSERTSKDIADTYAKRLQGRDDLAAVADALDQAEACYDVSLPRPDGRSLREVGDTDEHAVDCSRCLHR